VGRRGVLLVGLPKPMWVRTAIKDGRPFLRGHSQRKCDRVDVVALFDSLDVPAEAAKRAMRLR
jgi:hypothetical protein